MMTQVTKNSEQYYKGIRAYTPFQENIYQKAEAIQRVMTGGTMSLKDIVLTASIIGGIMLGIAGIGAGCEKWFGNKETKGMENYSKISVSELPNTAK